MATLYGDNPLYRTFGMESPTVNADYSAPALPGTEYFNLGKQAELDRAKLFIDRINSINLPVSNPNAGIPSSYTQKQSGQGMTGFQPMQMYQNRANLNQLGLGLQPMQMYQDYRNTGVLPTDGQMQDNTAQMNQLGTALNSLGGVNTSMTGTKPTIGGK